MARIQTLGRKSSTVGRSELDLRVAIKLGIPRSKVERVTAAFLEEVRVALVESGLVRLDTIGVLKVIKLRDNSTDNLKPGTGGQAKAGIGKKHRWFKVMFSKSIPLKEALRAAEQEKQDERRQRTRGHGEAGGARAPRRSRDGEGR